MTTISTTTKSRILYMDMVKGFAIICIIIGHLHSDVIRDVVYSFHVPIFLFVSGYFFSMTRPLKMRLWALIKPYISATLLVLFLYLCIYNRYVYGEDVFRGYIINRAIGALYGVGIPKTAFGFVTPVIGPLWFLLGLSWATAALWWMRRRDYTVTTCLAISIGLIALSIWSVRYVWLPLSIQAGMFSVLYMYLGFIARRYHWHESKWVVFLGTVLWSVAMYVNISTNSYLTVLDANAPHLFTDIAGSIGACVAVLAFFRWLERINLVPQLLVMFGQASLVVLCFHFIELDVLHNILLQYVDVTLGLGTLAVLVVLITFKLSWAWLWIKVHSKSKILQRFI